MRMGLCRMVRVAIGGIRIGYWRCLGIRITNVQLYFMSYEKEYFNQFGADNIADAHINYMRNEEANESPNNANTMLAEVLSEAERWLMVNSSIPVEKIIDLREHLQKHFG